jgi:hypothetical protein
MKNRRVRDLRPAPRVAREVSRLERIFRASILAAIAAAPGTIGLVACGSQSASATSSSSGGDGGGGGRSMSASTASSGGAVSDGGDVRDGACKAEPLTPDASDDAGDCTLYVRRPCGVPKGVQETGCTFYLSDCNELCGIKAFGCTAIGDSCVDGGVVDADGGLELDCSRCVGTPGRSPAGLVAANARRAGSPLGAYFAESARLEAASVHAFADLAADLSAQRAPRSLIAAARRAQRDERRHARLTGELARRFGAAPARPRVLRRPRGAFDDLALENLVEGCVRETYAALVASWQAAHATDSDVAQQMAAIARDEARHAALSWAIARWSEPALGRASRRRVTAAARRAIGGLRRGVVVPCAELTSLAGLPDRATQHALLSALEHSVWAELLASEDA